MRVLWLIASTLGALCGTILILAQLHQVDYFVVESLRAYYVQWYFLLAFAAFLMLFGATWSLFRHQPYVKRCGLGSLLACLVLWGSWSPLSAYFQKPVSPSLAQPGMWSLRLVQHNMWSEHVPQSVLIRGVSQLNADLVSLEEIDEETLDVLLQTPEFVQRYPFYTATVQYGQVLFSRWPIAQSKVVLSRTLFPILIADVVHPSQVPVGVVIIHPPHPTKAYKYAEQQDVFQAVIRLKNQLPAHFIVAGDFNATPFNQAFRQFYHQMELRDFRVGHGLQTTWPSYLPQVLRIPIDYALGTPRLVPVQQRVLPSTGSDHLPIQTTFEIR